MGVIQLSDEIQRLVDQQVAEGRAENAAAFVEAAVRQAIEQGRAPGDGLAMMGAPEGEKQVLTGMMDDLLARFGGGRGGPR